MEKKVPERKVSLHEEDVFYIYDKRINKCIREDCEGTVKYGLVLKVRVSEEESLNCFDCNKCHMKYSPYPNYVRLHKTDMLTIYNQDEVTARDQKRADDAAKQAAKEAKEKKLANRKRKSFGADNCKGQFRGGNRKPFDAKNSNADNRKQGDYHRPDERRFGDAHRPYGESSAFGERKPHEERRRQGEYRSYGEKRDFDKKPYQKGSYEGKPRFEKKRDAEGRQSKKSNIIITTGGYQKPFHSTKRRDTEDYRRREY